MSVATPSESAGTFVRSASTRPGDDYVGRPPRDLVSARAIAAEHYAFCPDNIQQGAGSIREYAALLVGEELWPFWWD